MVNEEQEQEIEVLQSIYPDELTVLSEDSFRIRIELETPPGYLPAPAPDDDDEEPQKPTLLLTVRYPPDYPNVSPELSLAIDPSGPRIFDFPADRDAILSSLESTISENLGMAMIFTLVTSIKESAEQLIQERHKAVEEAREEEARLEEEKEMAKFRGTPVTRETFMAWRAKFKEEMEVLKKQREKEKEEEEKSKRGSAATAAIAAAEAAKKRMTGKQLYLTGTVGKDDDVEVDGDEMDISKLKIQDEGK
ncbi:RWD domain-containing protein [Kalaharituber pfeilii]|nr:RWD domain-containing protein [Kalaharituber pfeilii]